MAIFLQAVGAFTILVVIIAVALYATGMLEVGVSKTEDKKDEK